MHLSVHSFIIIWLGGNGCLLWYYLARKEKFLSVTCRNLLSHCDGLSAPGPEATHVKGKRGRKKTPSDLGIRVSVHSCPLCVLVPHRSDPSLSFPLPVRLQLLCCSRPTLPEPAAGSGGEKRRGSKGKSPGPKLGATYRKALHTRSKSTYAPRLGCWHYFAARWGPRKALDTWHRDTPTWFYVVAVLLRQADCPDSWVDPLVGAGLRIGPAVSSADPVERRTMKD